MKNRVWVVRSWAGICNVAWGLAACLVMAMTAGVQAGNFTYTTNPDSTITITGYTGSSLDVAIPSSIDGKNVTSIGGRVFYHRVDLTSVTIPSGVTYIGELAFAYCSNLTSVTIPSSVTSIMYSAFAYCGSLTSVTIPDSVTHLKSGTFECCSNLTSVIIGNGVTVIGGEIYVFEDCSALTGVYFKGNAPDLLWGPLGDVSATVYYRLGTEGWGATFGGWPTAVWELALSGSTVAENKAAGTAVGTLSTIDVDTGDTYTYTLVSGEGSADNASFVVSGNTLQTAESFNFEARNSYSVRVRSTDQGSLTFEKVFTVTVLDANEAPTDLALSGSTVAENQAAGTTVGTLSTIDVDTGDTYTYTLVSGEGSTDNASFAVSGNTLKTASVFDYETRNSYSIRVRVTDSGNATYEKPFSIVVTRMNNAPAGADNAITIVEDTSYTFALCDFGFSDSDSPPNNFQAVKITTLPAAGTLFSAGSAVSAGQVINIVPVGQIWTPRESNREWGSVASSADGTKLVACVGGACEWGYTNSGQIYTSTDSGMTWTARESNRRWSSVASSADGTKLVACVTLESVINGGSGGQIYTSTDSGVTWTFHEGFRRWSSVASSADGTKLVAVDNGGPYCDGGQIYTSTDSGVTWTARENNRHWTSVASSADGTKLVACVSDGQIYTSTDSGVTWTARENNRQWKAVASSADGTKLVAVVLASSYPVMGGQIYTSTDSGVTWTARGSNRRWRSVACSADGTKLVAVGGDVWGAPDVQMIYTSTDSGVSWTARANNRKWYAVASSADGTKLVASVLGGQIYTSQGNSFAFMPTSNDAGSPYASFTFQVQDDGGTTNGGVDLDPNPKTMTINVTPVNEVPIDISLNTYSVAENQPVGTTVGSFSATDPDTGDTFSYALVDGVGCSDNRSFSISGSNLLTAASFDYEAGNSYSIRVRVTDSGSLTCEKQFVIRVTAEEVNELWRDGFENYALGALPSPWVLSGNTNAVVTDSQRYSGNQSVMLFGVLNGCWGTLAHRSIGTNAPFEVEFATRCGAEILGGCHPFYVTVHLFSGPSWTYSGRTLLRFQNDGKVYGGNWTDPTSGLVLGTFESETWYKVKIRYVVESQTNVVLTFWIDDQLRGQVKYASEPFESSLSYLDISSSEGTTYFDDLHVSAIIGSSMNRAPTDITLSASIVTENQPVGTKVGVFSATDPDAGETASYTLVSGEGSSDNGSFSISGSSLQTAASFDCEAKNSYSIRVRVTDSGNATCEKQFTITVTDVNDAPTGADNAITIVEDTSYTFALSDFGFSDSDSPANNFLAVKIPTLPAMGLLTSYGMAVSAGQVVSISPTGPPWIARASRRSWHSVACSADGTKLVAVESGGYGTYGLIYTSTDYGVTWTEGSGPQRFWNSVASSADGTKLVACALYGQIYTSIDSGVSWTPRTSANAWSSVVSSADGTKLVAVGGGQIYTSTDSGVTWTARESNRGWTPVASSADGTKLVAGVYGGQIYTSTDSGVTWTARESTRNWFAVASSADGTKLVAVDNGPSWPQGGQIYTSTDSGATWTARESNRKWYAVASSADGTKLVAATGGGWNGQIYTSTDSGVTWTASGSQNYWTSLALACSADGTRMVVVVNGDYIYTAHDSFIAFTPANNATGSLYTSFAFQMQDDGGTAHGGVDLDTNPKIMTINVTPVNDTPMDINLSTGNVVENQPVGTTVGILGSIDPDSGDTFIYALVDGAGSADNDSFSISGNTLKTASVFDYETRNSYSIRVRVTDSGRATYEKPFSIVVTRMNNAPAGADNAITIVEDTSYTFALSDFRFSDSDSPANNFQAIKITTLPAAGTLFSAGLAVSAGQVINLSPASQTWTAHESNRVWSSVASSADGTKLVAVDNAGPTSDGGQIYTSTDSGVTWTARESKRAWRSVACSGDGTKLVAVVDYGPRGPGGQIYTSTDSGETWTARESNRVWKAVASSVDGTKLVAVEQGNGYERGGLIYTSTDSGMTWTARASTRNWFAVASSADGTKLVAVDKGNGYDKGGHIYTSTDSGMTWTARASTNNWVSVACSADGTKLVAVVSGGPIYTSTDGATSWTARESKRVWRSVACSADGTRMVAVTSRGTSLPGGPIYTSTDSGVTWTARESNRYWSSVACSADGTKLVAVDAGNSGGQIYTTSQGMGNIPLIFTPASNGTGSPYASFPFQVQDDGGTAGGGMDLDPNLKTITISVTPVNDAPTDISLSASSVAENQPVGITVGSFSTTDPDVGDTFSYALVDGAGSTDNGSFTISGSSLLTGVSFDYEAKSSYSIRVRATDSGSATYEKQFFITVNNVNEAPTGVNNTVTIDETPYTFALSDFGFSDSDSPANNFQAVKITTLPAAGTLYLAGLAVSAGQVINLSPAGQTWTARESNRYWSSVACSADGTKLVAVDRYGTNYAGGQIYTSTDSGVTWTARESNRYWASVACSADGTKLVAADCYGTNYAGGQIYTSIDSGVTWTACESNRYWSCVASSADGTKLVAVVSGGQIYTSTDSGVTWTACESNRGWASVACSADGTKLVAVDRYGPNYAGGQIYTSIDSGVTWTARESNRGWSAVASSADGIRLVAVVNGGQIYTSKGSGDSLVFTPASNAAGSPYASFTFQVQDDGGTANGGVDLDPNPKAITINVTPVNNAPTDSTLSATSVAENQPSGTTVGTLGTTDPDAGDTAAYTLVAGEGGTDNGSFSISGASLLTAASFDYEAKSSYSIRVRVTDSGSATYEKQFTVTVNNVNDAPAGTDNTLTIDDTSYAFALSDFGFSDSDSPANNFQAVKITTLPAAGTLTSGGVAVSAGQVITPFPAGQIWTARESNRSWRAVASSADGTKLVAVVSGGQIYTSPDSGATWTPRETNRNWSAVACSADGTKLVAVVSGGQIYTSPDSGATWTPRETNRGWSAVASSANGTKLVAVDYSGPDGVGGQIYTSPDSGVTWTPHETNRMWSAVASSADGTKLVACVVGCVPVRGHIYTSADSGVTWTQRDSERFWTSVASSADGTKLVACATVDGQIYTSTDSGVTWTPRETNRDWGAVASSADGTKLVAVDYSGPDGVGGQIYTSPDSGVTWTPRERNGWWQDVASSSDGTRLVAVEFGGRIYTSLGGIPLSFTPANNAAASPYAHFTFQVQDDGGTANGGVDLDPNPKTMTINVIHVNDAPADITLSATSVAENQAVGTTVGSLGATDPDAGDTFSYALVDGAGGTDNASFSISGSSLLIAAGFDYEAKSSYSIRVRVTDSGSATYEKQFTVTVSNVNEMPVLPQQADRVVKELTLLTVTNTATDVDIPANTLRYTLTGPAGAAISATGVIIWTPDEAQGPGNYVFTTVATDDGTPAMSASNTFRVTVEEVNVAPALAASGDTTIDELAPWTVTATATDSDLPAQALAFSLVVAPSGMSIDPASGVVSWTPTEAQGPSTNVVTVRVADNGSPSLSATQSFQVVVSEVNLAPVLTVPANQTLAEQTLLAVTNLATDADVPANSLTFSLVAAPGGMSIDPVSGVVTWTPTEAQGPSTNVVTVRVADNGSPSLSVTQSFQVVVSEVNRAPVLTVPANQTLAEQTLLTVTNLAADADVPANSLTFSLVAAPSGMSIDPASGVVTWTPTEAQGPSTNVVTVRVADNGSPSLSATQSFQVVVSEVNRAPVLTVPANQTLAEQTLLTVTNLAADADVPANSPTFSLVAAPSGMSIDPASGVVTWTPTEAQGPSTNVVTVRVADNGSPSLSATQNFQVVVSEVNVAPVLTVPANQTLAEQTLLTVTNLATDSDVPANILTFSLVTAPSGMSIDPVSGVVTWTPTEAQGPSTNVVTVRVADNGSPSLSATQSFQVVANEVNVAPTDIALSATSVRENQPVGTPVGTLSAPDADLTDRMSFSLVAGVGGDDNSFFAIAENELKTAVTLDYETRKSCRIRVKVADLGGLSYEKAFTVTVLNVVELPTITSALTAFGTIGTEFRYTITASNSPTRFGAWDLPTWLRVDAGSGVLSGTPTLAGTDVVTIEAYNPDGVDRRALTLVVRDAAVPPIAPTEFGTYQVAVGQVGLKWRDNAFNEQGFKILRQADGMTAWDLLATLGADQTNHLDHTVIAGMVYRYRLYAFNTHGASPMSTITVRIPAPPAAPSALQAIADSANRIRLLWADNSTNELGFEISRKTGGIGPWGVIDTRGINATTYTNTGLSAGTLYTYRVRAFNDAGQSGYSPEASAITIGSKSFSLSVANLRLQANGVGVSSPAVVGPRSLMGGWFDAEQSNPVGAGSLHRVAIGFRNSAGVAVGPVLEIMSLYGVPLYPATTNLNVAIPSGLAAPAELGVYSLWVEDYIAGNPVERFQAAVRTVPDCLRTNIALVRVSNPVARVVRVTGSLGMPGQTVTLPIVLDSAGDENTLGFSLSTDSALLTNPRVTLGGDAGAAFWAVNTNEWGNGKLGLTLSMPPGVVFAPGTRHMLTLSCDIAAGAGDGSIPVSFADVPVDREVADADANPVAVTWSNGVVTVVTAKEADVLPAGMGDGLVTEADAARIGRFATKVEMPSVANGEFQRADCAPRGTKGDGRITVADWTQSRRYAVKLDALVSAGGPSTPALGGRADKAVGGRVAMGAGESSVRVVGGTIARGAAGTVTVQLAAQGNESALSFSLNYDTTLLNFSGQRLIGAAAQAYVVPNVAAVDQGRIGFAVSLPAGAFPVGTNGILELTFMAAPGNVAATTTLASAETPVALEVADASGTVLPASISNGTVVLSVSAGTATPAAATGLTVTVAAMNQVNLKWTDNADSESGYRVLRKTAASGDWSIIGAMGPNAVSFADVGLMAGTEYFYMIEVYNGSGSSFSTQAAGRTWKSLEAWRMRYFGRIENAGPAADAADWDNDGIANLLEYALGTDPIVQDVDTLLSVQLQKMLGSDTFAWSVYSLKGVMPADAKAVVEFTSNLVTEPWSVNTVSVQEPQQDGTIRVKVRSDAKGKDCGFFRLKAQSE